MEWILTNIGTLVVGTVLVLLTTIIILIMVKNKKSGKSSCGCGCENCSARTNCKKDN